MSPLVTGSLAYDYLIHIDGKFSDRWPLTPQSGFSAAYIAPALTQAVGGCAGNITYALHKLGEQATMMATAGSDFTFYANYLHTLGIGTEHVMILPDFYTAQAYIVTDGNNDQFIVFHPGATAEAHRQHISDLPPPPLAIVSPNGKLAMLQHCRDLAAAKVAFIFDPGQAVGMFNADELNECLTLAPYAIFNISEFNVVQQTTGMNAAAIKTMLQALFVTYSESGSEVFTNGESIRANCVHLGETKDPTGCGDAYRAGILYGLMRNWAWQPLLNFASIIAAIKATHGGGQGYAMSLESATAAYEQIFNQPLPQ